MRIAQVAPLYERVPPAVYGGTERVVSYLTEELVALGHEVTLFASGARLMTEQYVVLYESLCAGTRDGTHLAAFADAAGRALA